MEWYYVDVDKNQLGPVYEQDFVTAFRSGRANAESLCWNESMAGWSAIQELPELMAKLAPPTSRPGPPARGPPPQRGPAPVVAAAPVAAPRKRLEKKGDAEAKKHGGWKTMKTADGGEYYFNIHTEETTWDKPKELHTQEEQERDGEWYWLPDPDEAFVPAKKVGMYSGKAQFEKENGQIEAVKEKDSQTFERLYWSQLQMKTNDLVMLDVMNEPLIMYNLSKRFKQNEIYTNVGTILISCNPYKRLPLYTPQVLDRYMKKGTRKMPPHVFNSADDAFRRLREYNIAQSIVISGESGAGKTECTKQCLQYLAEAAGSAGGNVEQKILQSNPILEAFGNAKTVRNNNSSRFGKYIQIFFNKAGEICGAQNDNYLLEKCRVVGQNPGERNYHIFFQLLSGMSPDQRAALHLTNADDYFYLRGDKDVAGINDIEEFSDLRRAFSDLKFTDTEVQDVFKITAGVLQLGNIHFKSVGDRKCTVDHAGGSSVALNNCIELLQIDGKEFEKSVTSRTMIIRGQDPISVQLSKAEAEAARDALAKFIYEKLFDWLVVRINKSIGKGDAMKGRIIGILDIFGFEIFEQNAFEQLCINFTNEKLQQFFNQNTFKKEEEVYRYEKIKFDHVDYIDNQPVLDLIESKPNGILPLVDEELRLPKGSDKTFQDKLKQRHDRTASFKAVLKRPENFLVCHYAGDVEYESQGFLEKNKDRLNDDAYTLIEKSNFKFLSFLFNESASRATLGAKFRRQLNDLMSALNATEPHYIRCIKPNPNKAAMEFHGTMSLMQLRYAGVFEAIKIRKHGFPFRLTHKEFWMRYKCIMPRNHKWASNMVENCKFLITKMKQDFESVQIGTTRVLYRAKQHRNMELARNLALESVAVYIQKFCRLKGAKLLEQRAKMIRPVLAKALKSRDVDQLHAALAKAANVGFETKEIRQAKKMLWVFEEEKRLEQVFQVLMMQDPHQFFDEFAKEIAVADDCGVASSSANTCRQIHNQAKAERDAIEQSAVQQKDILDEDQMAAVIKSADDIGFSTETIEELRTLLYDTAEDSFVKMQLKAAVKFQDANRITKKTIRLKELFFEKAGEMFRFHLYPKLMPPEEWANEKFICLDRAALSQSMLVWSKNVIHANLSTFKDKASSKLGVKMFRNIMAYMGDKKYQYPHVLAQELLNTCLQHPELRDEVYCQLIKQLSQNPTPASIQSGWDLMLLCLSTFPPGPELENYLEMWLRTNANPMNRFVFVFHKTLYGGARPCAPNDAEFNSILSSNEWMEVEQKDEAFEPIQQPQGFQMAPAGPPVRQPAPVPNVPQMDQTLEWHWVDVNGGQNSGANANDLQQAASQGTLTRDCLVWNETLAGWVEAGSLPDLQAYCGL